MELQELEQIRKLPVGPNAVSFVGGLLHNLPDFDIWKSNLGTNIEEDGAVTIEFRLPHQRLLFSLEVDHDQSGWAFVVKNGMSMSGSLQGVDIRAALGLMWKESNRCTTHDD